MVIKPTIGDPVATVSARAGFADLVNRVPIGGIEATAIPVTAHGATRAYVISPTAVDALARAGTFAAVMPAFILRHTIDRALRDYAREAVSWVKMSPSSRRAPFAIQDNAGTLFGHVRKSMPGELAEVFEQFEIEVSALYEEGFEDGTLVGAIAPTRGQLLSALERALPGGVTATAREAFIREIAEQL